MCTVFFFLEWTDDFGAKPQALRLVGEPKSHLVETGEPKSHLVETLVARRASCHGEKLARVDHGVYEVVLAAVVGIHEKDSGLLSFPIIL